MKKLFRIIFSILLFLVHSCCKEGDDNTMEDVEGNVYKTVVIGTQIWMAENLKTTKYADGNEIPNVTNYRDWALSTRMPAYCWFDNDSVNKDIYGALYNWYAVKNTGLCPSGWHVPTDAEFKTLEMYLGMSKNQADTAVAAFRGTDQGTQMKSTTGWNESGNGTNSSAFAGLPGGYRGSEFNESGSMGFWWASDSAMFRALRYSETGVFRNRFSSYIGASVRCVKD